MLNNLKIIHVYHYNIYYMEKFYAAIDLKSFYSSVECHERGLDPLTTNLVVADSSRTEKTICLAVSPSLRAYGIPGRARLFEVIARVKAINFDRLKNAPNGKFIGKSANEKVLAQHPEFALDFVIAKPRMQKYIDYSQEIFATYLKHVAPDDIYAYSIDEVFCDISGYLRLRNYTPEEFVTMMIRDVYEQTGITATAGIGTNLYLAKIAMDIIAKHAKPNDFGVRIAKLDEESYRKQLWSHTPITDFWRIGRGTARKLNNHQMHTVGDVARCSIINEGLLFKLFGVNAELLIDHAWGIEPVGIHKIKNYQPHDHSLTNGQVLSRPYHYNEARIIVKEMVEDLILKLTLRNIVTDQLVLDLNYDSSNKPNGEAKTNHYGKIVPKPAHGTLRLDSPSLELSKIRMGFLRLFDETANPDFTIRKITLTIGNLVPENYQNPPKQLSLFGVKETTTKEPWREKNLQAAIIKIRKRFGKNAIFSGVNLEDGATGLNRRRQIGGHQE